MSTLRQHLIDPEICIRCNTCEATCPVGAITHDSRNYVVDASICNGCMACVPPCPTGSIDNWRIMPLGHTHSLADQLLWDELPAELTLQVVAEGDLETNQPLVAGSIDSAATEIIAFKPHNFSAITPPQSAAPATTLLYGPKAAQPHLTATISGNIRVTEMGQSGTEHATDTDYDTHHIVLDFGSAPMPLLEGQSIGIISSGLDANGRPHHARQYSIASPRDGERAGYNNASLTVKRVLADHDGKPVRGVASNFLCDAKIGDSVQVIGPFGATFLMPNTPGSHIVMICTGTGSAPMRAMTEHRRRLRAAGTPNSGKLMLFFGARSPQELPYFGPLHKLPADFIELHLAYSRANDRPKHHVQDLMREQAATLAPLLADPNTHFYVCGLKAMEVGVLAALEAIAIEAGQNWSTIASTLKAQGRLHLETY